MSVRGNAIKVVCALWLMAGVVACGSDDDDDGAGAGGSAGSESGGTGGTAGTAGDDAGMSSGGVGGSGGMGGSGGTSGTGSGGTGGSTGVMCGETLCNVNPIAEMFGIVACCTSDNECGGFGGKCHPLGQEGTPDEACPGAESSGFPLPGCCRPDGKCGVDYATVGWGCVERTEISAYMASGVPLEAIECGGGGDEDAGL